MGMQGLSSKLVLVLLVLVLASSPVVCGAATGASVPATDMARATWVSTDGPYLTWYHTLPGDFNQDGLVNGSDLTRFGKYFDLAASAGGFPDNSELSLIDANRDGRITSADMTIIGVHYNNDVLGGYNVYAAQSLDAYPDGNSAPSKTGALLLAHLALADTLTEAGATTKLAGQLTVRQRLRFQYIPDSIARYEYWWVRPVDMNGNEGTSSEPLQCPGVVAPRNDRSAAVASWDGAAATLTWDYYNLGDYNCDGWVSPPDISVIGNYYLQENTGDLNTAAGVIDTDGSGIVDPWDEFAVGMNWNHCVVGYNVYIADSSLNYPDGNAARSRLMPYTSVDFMYVEFPKEPYRPRLSVKLPDVSSQKYLWVRPYDWYGYEGTPSNLVTVE